MSAADVAAVTPFPLTPHRAAERLLLGRLEVVALDTYVNGLRLLYRVTCHDDDELGLLIHDFADRYPVGTGRKTPRIDAAFIRRTIRKELNLLSSTPVTAGHNQEWLRSRRRGVRLRERAYVLSAREREALTPDWGLEALATFLAIGPPATRERVENYGRHFAQGKDGFVSTKTPTEDGAAVPTPSAVRGIREAAAGLFDKGTTKLKARLGVQIPEWLAPWPGDWGGLDVRPNERSMRRRRKRVNTDQVKSAMLAADEACAKPFLARCGMTDIEVARDPDSFLASFRSPEARRLWIQNANVALLMRNRALCLLALAQGDRVPQLTALLRGDVHLPPFNHVGLAARWGIHREVGAMFVTRSEKSSSDRGAHYRPLPLEVCDRLRALLFVYELIFGAPITDSDPLFLKDLFSDRPSEGLGGRAIGSAAASILHRFGDESDLSDERAYNIIRRYTDSAILDYFDDYRQQVPGIPDSLRASTVKEISLDHERVTIDPHTYSGLSDDEGRFVVSCYGAEVVIQTIYGRLGVRLGPERDRVRSEVAVLKGLEQTKARLYAQHLETREKLRGLGSRGGLGAMSEGAALVMLADRQALQDQRDDLAASRDELTEQIEAQRAVIDDLLQLNETWVPLDDGDPLLTAMDVRQMAADLVSRAELQYPPLRDFYTLKELASVLDVDPSSIQAWISHVAPETVSRLCPWRGVVPVVRPNERTVLIAAGAIARERIANPAIWNRLQQRLAVWPSERGWDPVKGAKTNCVRVLASQPRRLKDDAANDLLADFTEDCIRIFRFRSE